MEIAYLFLPKTPANLGFRGNHWVQVDPALRGVLGCQEGLGVRQDRDYCSCSYWGSGSASYRFCSFVLQANQKMIGLWWTNNIYTNKGKVSGLLLLTSCSQTCLATERIIFWDAVSPWKTNRQSSGAWFMPWWLPGRCFLIPFLSGTKRWWLLECYGIGC